MKHTIFASAQDAHVEQSTDAPVVAIREGEAGYYPIYTRSTAEEVNGPEVTPEVIEAAVIGSMFGWRVPGAAPAVAFFRSQD